MLMKSKCVAILALGVAIAACGDKKKGVSDAPQGQVVAQVGGDEITMRELNVELRGAQLRSPEELKRAEIAALDAIVNRKILAAAARKQGVGDSADFQLTRQRAEEILLAEALQSQMGQKVARPSREEAEKYVATHPEIFAARKLYVIDQIQFGRPENPASLKEFEPLKSLDEVEQKLLRDNVEYRRVPSSIDARNAPAAMMKQIASLPANEVFLIPTGNTILVNQIKSARTIPFTGEPAIAFAQQVLASERVNGSVIKQLEAIRKAAGTVNYKKGYNAPGAAAAPAQAAGTPVKP